jgi:hypothetical protein
MTPKLTPGTRVSVTLDDGKKYKAFVHKLMPHGNLMLRADLGCPVGYPVVHPKQCRRLIRKPKAEKRKDAWVNVMSSTRAIIKYEPQEKVFFEKMFDGSILVSKEKEKKE